MLKMFETDIEFVYIGCGYSEKIVSNIMPNGLSGGIINI